MSDVSAYRTATTNTPVPSNISSQPSSQSKRPKIPKDEFGLTEMLAIIESKVSLSREPPPPALDEVDRLLFGPKLDLETIHPQIREVYSGTLKKMEDLDNVRFDIASLLPLSISLMKFNLIGSGRTSSKVHAPFLIHFVILHSLSIFDVHFVFKTPFLCVSYQRPIYSVFSLSHWVSSDHSDAADARGRDQGDFRTRGNLKVR